MKQGYYYIVAIGLDGITYYYHSNNQFYWNSCDISKKIQFKTWKKKSYAEKKFETIFGTLRFKSIYLKHYNPELDGSTIIATKRYK